MKKTIVVILSSLLLLSLWVCTFAGIPPSLGLPTVNISSADNNKWNISGSGISNTSVTMNNGSVMCVDCHTRNPGYYAPLASFPGGTRSLNFVGSHFVTNTYADTNTGGGYAGSVSGARSNQYYVKYDAWTTTGKTSKYGKVTGGSLFSDNTAGSGVTGRQLICESCHNITRNFGRYKLLGPVDTANLAGDSGLCSGCHADMRQAVNNEPSFFDNTTPGNQHHRNYQTTTLYGGAATLGTHDARRIAEEDGYYGTGTVKKSKLWAASYGQLTGLPRNATYASSTNPGIKTVNSATDYGMIHIDNNAGLYCLSCHRAHNAVSSTSALILRTGDNNAYSWGGGTIPSSATYLWQALRRQNDFGDPSNWNNRLIKDDRPLCNGCHQNR